MEHAARISGEVPGKQIKNKHTKTHRLNWKIISLGWLSELPIQPVAERRMFFAVNRLSSLERKRARGSMWKALSPTVKLIFVKIPKKPHCGVHADSLSSCFKVEVSVEAYSWKTTFLIFFSRWLEVIDGNFGENMENYLKWSNLAHFLWEEIFAQNHLLKRHQY